VARRDAFFTSSSTSVERFIVLRKREKRYGPRRGSNVENHNLSAAKARARSTLIEDKSGKVSIVGFRCAASSVQENVDERPIAICRGVEKSRSIITKCTRVSVRLYTFARISSVEDRLLLHYLRNAEKSRATKCSRIAGKNV